MADSADRTATDHHVYTFDPDETPSEAVITAVAAVTDQPPVELPVLNDTIDPGALDRLFEDTDGNAPSPTVTFEYFGCVITVTSSEVQVECPVDGGRRE